MCGELKEYVVKNIDRAVEEGYIRVFYQPVARTITGDICGMEALARWDDPEHGLLSPAVFIEALEEAGLIHKLDSCIVRRVCEDYRYAQEKGLPFTPVSFNLSRLDFRLCNMVDIINKAAYENNVPLDMLRVEITESVIADDRPFMHDVFSRLANLGYRVWMDDFGSGYSSLNFLKDFDFETLKIDMLFLSDFNERSKSIITSIVDMAKRIGIHTLAEGVETAEQAEFLKSIGCEKVQGYYFGKPMPFSETLKSIEERGLKIEPLKMRTYYHDMASVNILSATPFISTRREAPQASVEESQIPLAIAGITDDVFHFYFANEAYMKELKSIGVNSLEELEKEYADRDSALYERDSTLYGKALHSDKTELIDFIRQGQYCRVEAKKIASYNDGFALLIMLRNYSRNSLVLQKAQLDTTLRSLYAIYNRIELLDLDTGYSRNLFLSRHYSTDYNKEPFIDELAHFAKHEVFPEDRKRFREYFDFSTIEDRINATGLGYVSARFRLKDGAGGYSWAVILLISAGDRKLLSCERRIDANIRSDIEELYALTKKQNEDSSAHISHSLLWDNMSISADIAVFWKDKERRFLGANQSFLDYFGIKDIEELIGKTDEDMGWFTDPDPFRKEEERILNKGERTYLVPGRINSKGHIRNILISKYPILSDGRISGLMGYLFDKDQFLSISEKAEKTSRTDTTTGLMDIRGLTESSWAFSNSYVNDAKDFVMVYIKLTNYLGLKNSYGKVWMEHLLKAMADSVLSVISVKGIAAHPGPGIFIIMYQCESKENAQRLIDELNSGFSDIHDIDGIPCTIYTEYGHGLFSETGDIDDLRRLCMDRLNEKTSA